MTNNNDPLHLEEELQNINRRFENGEMKAFGANQAKVLKELQDIRIMQAQLSLKQVSLGSEKMMNQGDSNVKDFMESASIYDVIKDKHEDLAKLTGSLLTICKSVEQTTQSMKQPKQ